MSEHLPILFVISIVSRFVPVNYMTISLVHVITVSKNCKEFWPMLFPPAYDRERVLTVKRMSSHSSNEPFKRSFLRIFMEFDATWKTGWLGMAFETNRAAHWMN